MVNCLDIRVFASKFEHSRHILNKRQTAHFCSQLKMMLASGMSLVEALTVIKGLAINKKYYCQIRNVISKINEGYLLSESAIGFLPPLVVGSLRVAERSGSLEETLANLSGYYENQADLEEKVFGSLVYPCFILILSFMSVLVLIFFVLPGLRNLFSDLEIELPFFTNAVLSFSDFLSRFWLGIVGFPIVAMVFVKRWANPERIENFFLRVPLVGKLIRQELIIQGFATMGALLSGGTPILETLTITADSSRSVIFKDVILSAREGVRNGEKLSEEFDKSNFFPKETIQMLKVGEGSGQLAEMLSNIASFQAKEREAILKRFTTLLEPALTLSVGLVVGFIVLAMFLPMVNMVSRFQ